MQLVLHPCEVVTRVCSRYVHAYNRNTLPGFISILVNNMKEIAIFKSPNHYNQEIQNYYNYIII